MASRQRDKQQKDKYIKEATKLYEACASIVRKDPILTVGRAVLFYVTGDVLKAKETIRQLDKERFPPLIMAMVRVEKSINH